MKINFIIPSTDLSGGIRMIFLYANALIERGHDVICYYPLFGAYRGWKKYFAFYPLKSLLKYAIHPQQRKAEWFRDMKFKLISPLYIHNNSIRDADITIATFWLTAYWVQKLHKGKKAYFIQGYENWENHRKINGKNSYKLKFDLAITVSSELKTKLLEETGLSSIVVCNGVPHEEIGTKAKKITEQHIYIGFPYREGTLKNCSTAINVLKKVSATTQVAIMSYGQKKPENWPEEWDFLTDPDRKELYDFYEKTDIFYIPSLHEGWGLPAMEAMAHGNAVLSGNFGIVAESGIDNINCKILTSPDNVDEAVVKILDLICNPEKRREIGYNAYDMICNNYLFSKSCDNFEKVLSSICDEKENVTTSRNK